MGRLLNGNMELDSNWIDSGSPTVNERSTEQAHTGTYSRKFTTDATDEGISQSGLTVVAGETIKVGFWVYLPLELQLITIKVLSGDGSTTDLNFSSSTLAGNEWNYIEKTYTVAVSGNAAKISLLSNAISPTDTWYIDDVTFDVVVDDDNGVIADIERGLVDSLNAITLSNESVFKTVDQWRFQVQSPDDFKRYAPFALIEYEGDVRASWEGDHDLHERLSFSIRIGQETPKRKEGARIGMGTDASSRELGISRMRDLVITNLQNKRILTTDDKHESMEYVSSTVVWSEPNRYAIIMKFEVDRVDSYPPR